MALARQRLLLALATGLLAALFLGVATAALQLLRPPAGTPVELPAEESAPLIGLQAAIQTPGSQPLLGFDSNQPRVARIFSQAQYESDSEVKAAEDVHFHGHGSLVVKGFEQGLDPTQSSRTRHKCMKKLNEVSGPLLYFLENITASCKVWATALTSCIPAVIKGFKDLGKVSKAKSDLKSDCPPKMWLLFTAGYDPFLPPNMMTMALLHAVGLTTHMNAAVQAFAESNHFLLGFHLGRVIDTILPRLRLPLSSEDMTLMVLGFVESFEPRHARGNGSLVTFRTNSNVSNSSHLLKATCIAGVEEEVKPANDAIEQLSGSMLNISCYTSFSLGNDLSCLQRTWKGLEAITLVVHNLYKAGGREQRAACPERFRATMRRFDDKVELSLDLLTNFIEDFGRLMWGIGIAANAYYDGDLYQFGRQLGDLSQVLAEKAFTRYEHMEITWTEKTASQRLFFLIIFPPLLFCLALAPLLCLFCSAISGQPPMSQEITVQSKDLTSEVSLRYEFFGNGGAFMLQSEIEIDVDPMVRRRRGLTGELGELDVMVPSSASEMGTDSESFDESFNESCNDTFDSEMVKKHMSTYGDRDIAAIATERLVMRLTDKLPDMNCAAYLGCHLLWCMAPCLAGGQQRWEAARNVRLHDGRWANGGDLEKPVHVSLDDSDGEGQDMPMEGEPGQFKSTFFANGLEQKAPVPDYATPMTFQVGGMKAAVLRLKPTTNFKECWDLLLFFSAILQLIASSCSLSYMVCFSLDSVLLNGELPTFYWRCCCFTAALLVLHKKVHARWWIHTHRNKKRITETEAEFTCFGYARLPRTETPVSLISEAPGVLEQPYVTKRHTPDGIYVLIVKFLLKLRPFAYRYYCQLREDDWVVVRAWPPWRPKRGALGKLRQSRPDENGYLVEFPDGSLEYLLRNEFMLQDECIGTGPDRPGYWHDRLTPTMLKTLAVVWCVCVVFIMILPDDAVTDDDGYMALRLLDAKGSQWSKSITGVVAALQLLLIMTEGAMRFVAWAAMRLVFLFFYRGF